MEIIGVIIYLGLVVLFFGSLVLPWIHRRHIKWLSAEVLTLKKQLQSILMFLEKEEVKLPADFLAKPKSSHSQEPHEAYRNEAYQKENKEKENFSNPDLGKEQNSKLQVEPTIENVSASSFPKQEINQTTGQETRQESRENSEKENQYSHIYRNNQRKDQSTQQQTPYDVEQQLGMRLSVWIGGVALALAGFFLVKYSIEAGLLSPSVRVILGVIFGGLMLYAADLIRKKESLQDGVRIAQALSGAGIAVLYISIYAATNLYDLIPVFIGFAGMAGVTATAVLLSLRYGMPIAMLGLIGGFLTPAMVSSQNPQAPLLFIYLYFVLAGLMFAIRKEGWWMLGNVAVLASFVWVCVWLFGGNFVPNDSICLILFLMAVSATVVATSKQHYEKNVASNSNFYHITSVLNYLTLVGAMLLGGVVSVQAGYGFTEWSLFGLLSLGGICLAFYNQKLYGLVPWVSMAVNAVMLVGWDTADPSDFAVTLSMFAFIYIGSGYILQLCSERPLIWAGLTSATSIGYYLLAYYELRYTAIVASMPMFWGILALVFAGLSFLALLRIIKDISEQHPEKHYLLAIYAATATAFLSIALSIELPREFLSVAFAAEMLAISYLYTKLKVEELRYIVGILACVFGFLLIPQILLIVQLTAFSLVEAKLALQEGVPIVNFPAFQLGLPAIFFVTSSYLLRLKNDSPLIDYLEIAAIALFGMMGYYLTRHAFHVDENILFVKAGFFERGVITNIIFVYGLGCLWVGRNFLRKAVTLSGLVLCGVALFRIGYFDLILYNPFVSEQKVGSLPLLNALLLTYAVPIFWIWRAIGELPHIGKPQWSKYAYGFMLLLSFVLVSMNVRQLFQGTYLNGNISTNAEIYTYSIAWLLFGVCLLFAGTFKKDKMIRVASLGVMILTITKVFLYDASELEGLFRVFSFLGLGLSLLGLSWFYTRFVFGERNLFEQVRKKD